MPEDAKCQCQSISHGHKPGDCEQPATEKDGYCKTCHDRALKEALEAMNYRGGGDGR